MEILKNGSTLLIEIPTADGESVVLAKTETSFVTWRKNDQSDTFWGDYYPPTVEGLKDAITSLETRAA